MLADIVLLAGLYLAKVLGPAWAVPRETKVLNAAIPESFMLTMRGLSLTILNLAANRLHYIGKKISENKELHNAFVSGLS